MESSGLPVRAFPVVAGPNCATWVPLDQKGTTRFIEVIEKKGLKSPFTTSTLEALTAQGPLLPHDITNLMRMALKPVQYTLREQEFRAQCRQTLLRMERDDHHPLRGGGTNMARLTGMEDRMATPQGQAALLRLGELLATMDAMLKTFRRFTRDAEPPAPWTVITQEPTESFQQFADRLIHAVEGSELPLVARDLVIVDCLKQKSHEDIKVILRSAPEGVRTPGDIIKYVLDKQKGRPVTVESLVARGGWSYNSVEIPSKGRDRCSCPRWDFGKASPARPTGRRDSENFARSRLFDSNWHTDHKFIVRATVHQLSIVYAIPLQWRQDAHPVWVDQWPLTQGKLAALQQLVTQELWLGHIEPSLSRWNTPVFVIKKRSGAFRLLHDLHAVNSQLIPFGPVQQGGPVLSAVPRNWPLVVIDLKDCFFSIPLAEQDREAFAFTVPAPSNQSHTDRYQWCILPQGMACSPTICQLVVGRILEPLRGQFPACQILHYMDDLLLAAPTDLILEALEIRVLSALTAAGFTISREKIQHGLPVEYLGHLFGPDMVRPTGLKILPQIKTLWDVQKLVGAIQWVRNALGIPPQVMKPFYDQLRGSDPNEPREFIPEMAAAWEEIMSRLMPLQSY
ncbi:LOW QUALITY PROTEIN: uncharacterized protein LOC110402288 [Numida meleagris]|uniref:LOW QUALITY PROTEIN: uncharacterized protein LOC110402288 n=1 Tax=Numida meleagris TaxID=8996 RepID=UPI000B3DF110|nr:LOW QUALITY PROTEIN: uncharacterized protein LOC110402288 [Numida meleagris]